MSLLSVSGLGVTRGKNAVLSDISFDVAHGEVIGLIGPNGAGKTTLMRALLGLLPSTGHASLAELAPNARAQRAAWMPQAREIAWPVDVQTLVALGRIPHLGTGAKPSATDTAAIAQALAHMGLESLSERTATQLSGGEQARALIARALAQETPLLIADEPVAGLDPCHQITTMECFGDLARADRSVIVSLHDLGLAARHCTRLLVLHQGRLVADGAPHDVLNAGLLHSVFGITAWSKMTDQGFVFQPLEALG